MLRCPICGSEVNHIYIDTIAEKKSEIIDGTERTEYKCNKCNSFMCPVELKHDFQYYHDKAAKEYGSQWRDELVILDEIKEYGLFDEAKHRQASNIQSAQCLSYIQKNQQTDQNKPKCPTCNSTNIQKISATSKVVGASLFGLFSKNATSQFKCNNCGYKW